MIARSAGTSCPHPAIGEEKYTLPAPPGATTVAVKLIDMLGEEVVVTEHLAAPAPTKGR